MKTIEKLRYQVDVVATLVDNPKENYILWVDTENRMIETLNGINKLVTGYDRKKMSKLCGYID